MFNNTPTSSLLNRVALWLTLGLIGVAGLINLPFTNNFVQDTKLYALMASALLIVGIYGLYSWQKKSLNLVFTKWFWPVLALLVASVVSSLVASNYPVENLLGWGGAYIAFGLIVLLGAQVLPTYTHKLVGKAIAIVGLINVLGSAFQMIGFGPAQLYNQLFGLSLPTELNFSFAGGVWISFQIALLGLSFLAWESWKEKKISIFNAIIMPLLIIGIGLYGWSMRQTGPAPLKNQSFLSSWSIALDNLRAPRTAMIGAGPESYTNSFRQYKPIWVNGTEDWSLIYNSANNQPLTILTTMGILGVAAWLWLVYRVLRTSMTQIKKSQESPLLAPVLISIVLCFFFPANIVLITIQAVMLAALVAIDKKHLPSFSIGGMSISLTSSKGEQINEAFSEDRKAKNTNLPVYFLCIVILAGTVAGIYGLYRGYYPLMLLRQADLAAANNDATQVYDLQQKAVTLNPYLDINRRSYAYTNVLIAGALANKAEVSDEDKEQINLLLQQAVREASAATVLDPLDSQNWQVLANIYSNMIGLAEDAPQWTTQAYINAIQTYPTDPNLRIALGGVLVATDQAQQAVGVLGETVNIKPDYANTHYNLAVVLKQLGSLEDAMTSYQQTLALVDSGSEDFIKLNQEIEALQKEIDALPKSETDETGVGTTTTPTNSITNQQLETQPTDLVNTPPVNDLVIPEAEPTEPSIVPSDTTTPEAPPVVE